MELTSAYLVQRKGENHEVVFIITIAVINQGLGFIVGKYHERLEWNNLIKARRINPPLPPFPKIERLKIIKE